MAYVEWLRVRGTLKWTTIVLGILFVLAWWHGSLSLPMAIWRETTR